MRLCSFKHNGAPTYGAVRTDGRLADLKSAIGATAPASLEDLIEGSAQNAFSLDGLQALAEKCEPIEADAVDWLPPIRRPGKVLGVAINNKIGQQAAFRPSENPAFFAKPASSFIGHEQTVTVREEYGVTHPEPELAVIIGRRGKDIAETQALSYVFGYTIINDITSPGLKAKDSVHLRTSASLGDTYSKLMSWRDVKDEDDARNIYLTYHAISKGADCFGPIGPWVVTPDEIKDPNNLTIRSYDGEELVFEDSTANLTFPVQRVIAHASRYMTLEPGDILHCGTSMRAVENGKYSTITGWDIRRTNAPMRISVEGVGTLCNPVECA